MKRILNANYEDMQAVRHAVADAKTRPIRPGYISLITMPSDEAAHPETLFVYWKYITTREGRRVTLDNAHRIKAVVWYQVAVEDFSACMVVLPSIGVEYSQSGRARERIEVPLFALKAQFHERLAVFSGPFVFEAIPTWLSADAKECVVCSSSRAFGIDQKSRIGNSSVYFCKCCATAWHQECRDMGCFGPLFGGDAGFVCLYCHKR